MSEPDSKVHTHGAAGQTILLVEPDPPSLVALAMILRALGYLVFESDGAGEIVRHLKETSINLLMINDLTPRKKMAELTEHLRQMHRKPPVLFLSDRKATARPGATFLRRPVSVAVLARTLQDLLARAPVNRSRRLV